MEAILDFSEELIRDLTNQINEENLMMIEKQYVHKQNQDYVMVSEVKDITDYVLRKNESKRTCNERFFYATAFPKYNCAFCFDHELDHLPFMMTIEVIRQVGIAVGHKYHGFPIIGFSNIMDQMRMNIDKFIELDIPLLVLLKDVVLKSKGTMQERIIYFDLYQNNIHCARIEINAIIMRKELYTRIRKTNRLELIKNTSLSETPMTNIKMIQNLN